MIKIENLKGNELHPFSCCSSLLIHQFGSWNWSKEELKSGFLRLMNRGYQDNPLVGNPHYLNLNRTFSFRISWVTGRILSRTRWTQDLGFSTTFPAVEREAPDFGGTFPAVEREAPDFGETLPAVEREAPDLADTFSAVDREAPDLGDSLTLPDVDRDAPALAEEPLPLLYLGAGLVGLEALEDSFFAETLGFSDLFA